MLARHSLNVGIGSEFGSAKGARGGGSRKIWCDMLLCLYLCPRRCPTFCTFEISVIPIASINGILLTDFKIGPFDNTVVEKLNGPGEPLRSPEKPSRIGLSDSRDVGRNSKREGLNRPGSGSDNVSSRGFRLFES